MANRYWRLKSWLQQSKFVMFSYLHSWSCFSLSLAKLMKQNLIKYRKVMSHNLWCALSYNYLILINASGNLSPGNLISCKSNYMHVTSTQIPVKKQGRKESSLNRQETLKTEVNLRSQVISWNFENGDVKQVLSLSFDGQFNKEIIQVSEWLPNSMELMKILMETKGATTPPSFGVEQRERHTKDG